MGRRERAREGEGSETEKRSERNKSVINHNHGKIVQDTYFSAGSKTFKGWGVFVIQTLNDTASVFFAGPYNHTRLGQSVTMHTIFYQYYT